MEELGLSSAPDVPFGGKKVCGGYCFRVHPVAIPSGQSPFTTPPICCVQSSVAGSADDDLYVKLKRAQRGLEMLEIQVGAERLVD